MDPIITTGIRQWKSQTPVRAEEILSVTIGPQNVLLQFERGHALVSHQWNIKHHPQVGNFFIAYECGFSTCLPYATFTRSFKELPCEA